MSVKRSSPLKPDIVLTLLETDEDGGEGEEQGEGRHGRRHHHPQFLPPRRSEGRAAPHTHAGVFGHWAGEEEWCKYE